tara:strand:+ start:3597 stop:4415 length:819 start_codon:yes stop_codon:yes gene_type:complete
MNRKSTCNPITNRIPTINPYLFAAKLVWQRFKWDLKNESRKSRNRLKVLQDAYTGQKCVILCNGPSLLKVDFDLLKKQNIYAIGLNKINLLFDKTDFRPDAIVAVNQHVIEQNRDFFNDTNIELFLDYQASGKVSPASNITFLHSTDQSKFARDCSVSVQQGFTVTYVAMQLAFHMGFKTVALVGCDHSFASKGPANKTVVSGTVDESHFDPNYFAGGVPWQLPDLAGSEYYYDLAGQTYNAFDRSIINATEGGKLDIFPRSTLKAFLETPL